MKKILCLVAIGLFVGATLGMTLPAFADDLADKCRVQSEAGKMPEGFSVGNCLLAPGQEKSKFIPKATKKGEPGPDGAAAPAAAPTNQVAYVLVNVIDFFVKLVGSVALIVFILGALLTIVSEGKEDRLEKGKSAMLYSLIGLAIAMFSFLIVTFVQSILF